MSLNAAIAVTRFGLGAKKGEIDQASRDPQAWVKEQLIRPASLNPARGNLKTSSELIINFQSYAEQRRSSKGRDMEDAQKAFRRGSRSNLMSEIVARTAHGAETPLPVQERFVRFWSNHFTVSGRNLQTSLVAGAYEREAIRPNILGSFYDLAQAAIFHPAMLMYLDNSQSVGPNSRAGKRRDRGLNENLAREVLELHTVTPAAQYSQNDVTEFARALTGWTVGNRRLGQDRRGETVFASVIHEPGQRTVLGKRYRQSDGSQARAILKDLCQRPETARNVAFKLARHVVDDAPPQALVRRLETVFRDTGGNLKSVYDALIDVPEAWNPAPEKVKTPDELLTSAARLIGVEAVFAGDPRSVFQSFAQRPFLAPSPEGWPDTADAWLGPDALTKRIEWAGQVSQRTGGRIDSRNFLETALGARVSTETLKAVSRAESAEQALTLALMSPDFQRR